MRGWLKNLGGSWRVRGGSSPPPPPPVDETLTISLLVSPQMVSLKREREIYPLTHKELQVIFQIDKHLQMYSAKWIYGGHSVMAN